MVSPGSVDGFLRSVHEVANAFSGLRTGDDIEPLYHNFWSPEEIATGRLIKEDWEVPAGFVPFYGDWHTLLCISEQTGQVRLLNEEHDTIFAWESSGDFLRCLTTSPEMEKSSSLDGVIENETYFDF